eukprot:406784-Pelagomonas_calceolata.AAC.1
MASALVCSLQTGFKTLLEAYEAAKKAGIHATIQSPFKDAATEIMGLLSQKEKSTQAKGRVH